MAGWQFVRQTEALLRQGQEQALLASASTLAKAFVAAKSEWPPNPVIYVNRLPQRVVVDGYADDWVELKPYAQALGPVQDAQKLRVSLGENADGLYLLAEVRDATRNTRRRRRSARDDERSSRARTLARRRDTALSAASAAPGPFQARATPATGTLPERLAAAWQEDGSGYRVELRISDNARPDRIGIGVYDAAEPSVVYADARALLAYDAQATHALAALVPDHAPRARRSADGWLVADAGALESSLAERRANPGDSSGGSSIAASSRPR